MYLPASADKRQVSSRTKLFVNSARYAEPDGSATVDSF